MADEDEEVVEVTTEEEGEGEEEGVKSRSKTSKPSKTSVKSRDTSQEPPKNQYLFLAEFLVDSVTLDPCAVDEEVLQGQTCLCLSFLNFPQLEICEKCISKNKASGCNKVKFNCGKSLMFAFNEKQCENPPPLVLEIAVNKVFGECDDSMVNIGVIKVCVSEVFHQIVEIAKLQPEKLPASKAIKDCFMLIGPGKRTMGEVSVYIRLSCLGNTVVTEFQCGADMKTSPFLFKSKEGKKAFEFSTSAVEGSDGYNDPSTNCPTKTGCGCIKQPVGQQQQQQQGGQGGQGDAGQGCPNVGKAFCSGNRVVLDFPEKKEGEKANTNTNTNTKCKGGSKGRSKANNMTQMVETNPDQNCFVLRVGDKGQIQDRGKMILEFRTPKQKILPKVLPPYHEDIAVQTDSPKKGKGKGKKK